MSSTRNSEDIRVTVNIDSGILEKVDRMAEKLSDKYHVEVRRSDVLRALIPALLERQEQEGSGHGFHRER